MQQWCLPRVGSVAPAKDADARRMGIEARTLLRQLDLEIDTQTRLTVLMTSSTGPAAQIGERLGMRSDEIGDVNIVADAGTVRCRIVGAEHLHFRERKPRAVSAATLMRWVAPAVDWPVRPSGSAPATLK